MARLLLIDDDPDLLLRQVSHLFAPRDVEVKLARSGSEGLAGIEAHKPHVVLLDVSLPDLSGLEVYRRLRKIDARIPVVFITARTAIDTAIEAMRLGTYDYLFKPVDLHQLEQVVREALDVSRRMRDAARWSSGRNHRTATATATRSSAARRRCARCTMPSGVSRTRRLSS